MKWNEKLECHLLFIYNPIHFFLLVRVCWTFGSFFVYAYYKCMSVGRISTVRLCVASNFTQEHTVSNIQCKCHALSHYIFDHVGSFLFAVASDSRDLFKSDQQQKLAGVFHSIELDLRILPKILSGHLVLTERMSWKSVTSQLRSCAVRFLLLTRSQWVLVLKSRVIHSLSTRKSGQ